MKQLIRCALEEEEDDETEKAPQGRVTQEEVDAVTGGVKEAQTTTTKLDRQPKELHYLKPSGKVVFAISQYTGSLYRSTNYGATWKNQAQKLKGFDSPKSGVFSASLSPADNNVVAFAGTGGMNWFTTDGGETYVAREYDWLLKKGGVKRQTPEQLHRRRWLLPSAECEER